jgi:lipopolysaccharide transport system permease protein
MLRGVWTYRRFIRDMVAREFRGRYRGSLLGAVWVLLQPLALILVYTLIFSRIMRARLPGVDNSLAYSLYLCAGVFSFDYFGRTLSRCTNCFVEQANLLKKIAFPRSTLPAIALASSTLDFVIVALLFTAFLLVTGRFPGWSLLGFVPILLVLQGMALGLGILMGSVNVFFRDLTPMLGIVLQFWFWLTPIVYPLEVLPLPAQDLLLLNPVWPLVAAAQGIVLHGRWPEWSTLLWPALVALLFLCAGRLAFKRLCAEMVDEL